MKTCAYTVNIEPDDVGGFRASVPALSGCTARGESYAAALAAIREAIEGHLESLGFRGKAIPTEAHAEPPQVVVAAEPLLPPAGFAGATWSAGRSRGVSFGIGHAGPGTCEN